MHGDPNKYHHIHMGHPTPQGDDFVMIPSDEYETWRCRWRTEMGQIENICSELSVAAHALEVPGYQVTKGDIIQLLDKAVKTIQMLWVDSVLKEKIGQILNGQ